AQGGPEDGRQAGAVAEDDRGQAQQVVLGDHARRAGERGDARAHDRQAPRGGGQGRWQQADHRPLRALRAGRGHRDGEEGRLRGPAGGRRGGGAPPPRPPPPPPPPPPPGGGGGRGGVCPPPPRGGGGGGGGGAMSLCAVSVDIDEIHHYFAIHGLSAPPSANLH